MKVNAKKIKNIVSIWVYKYVNYVSKSIKNSTYNTRKIN